MIIKIVMPQIDANVDEATVGPWIGREGQRFRKGDPLVEIITDKATFELEAEQDGLLRRIIALEKSTIPIGYVLALASDDEKEALPDVEEENRRLVEEFQRKSGLAAAGEGAAEPAESASEERERPARRVRATPAARRLARQRNVDLAEIENPEGRMLTEKDIEAFMAEQGNR